MSSAEGGSTGSGAERRRTRIWKNTGICMLPDVVVVSGEFEGVMELVLVVDVEVEKEVEVLWMA